MPNDLTTIIAKHLIVWSVLINAGCSANSDRHLQIRHSFIATEQNEPKDGFDFSMTWYVPPSVLFGNEKNSIIANMGLMTLPQQNPTLSISNETRLRLEEIAVKRLDQELRDNQMCQQGYRIQRTKWLERSISFVGTCL
jgi:hypothetical protein